MTLLSDVVKVIDEVTQGLGMQAIVTHKVFTGDGGIGDAAYTIKKRKAAVTQKLRQVRSFSGELVASNTTVTFVRPTTMGVDGGAHDLIILADGTGGAVVGVSAPHDASNQLIAEAYLG